MSLIAFPQPIGRCGATTVNRDLCPSTDRAATGATIAANRPRTHCKRSPIADLSTARQGRSPRSAQKFTHPRRDDLGDLRASERSCAATVRFSLMLSGHDRWTSIPSCWPASSSPSRSRSTSFSRASPSGCRPSSRRCWSCWLRTGGEHYHRLARFWTKIFAVSFAHGRRLGHRAQLPVRHQLEPLLGRRRQRHRAADRLRGADRLLPRSDLPRRDAVRLEPGAALAARRCPPWWSRSAPRSRRSGFCRPTAGCRRRPATRCATASPIRSTGSRSSSIRASLTASPTCSPPPISRPRFVVLAVGARYLLAGRHRRRGAHHDAHGDRHARGARRRCSSSSATSTGSTR